MNGAAEAFGRLFPKRLLALGLPRDPDPIVWLTAHGLVALAAAGLALRIVEARIDNVRVARRVYPAACFIGALGLIVLALAPDHVTGMAGVVLVSGISWTVTRCVSVIWVNRRATSDVRATVQSFLAQAESFGEIFLGIGLGILAHTTSIARPPGALKPLGEPRTKRQLATVGPGSIARGSSAGSSRGRRTSSTR